MKKNDLRDALSGINKDYIAESDDFRTVAAAFRKQRWLKNKAMASTLCFLIVGVLAIGITQSGMLKRKLQMSEKGVGTVSSIGSGTSEAGPAADAAAVSAEERSVPEAPVIDEPLYYSKLVRNTEIPDLDVYAETAPMSIKAFEESMLKDSAGVIEGEILDIWVNHYEYETASDKFEPDGRLYHKLGTVAYKIKADRVFSGDFTAGDVVTIEDYCFFYDPIISVKKGGSYVIPIGEGDGRIYEADEITGGDTSLERRYYTLYQCHPQIEKVDGGYIVPADWKTLITQDCSEIIMDIDENGSPFSDPLYYVPESVFNDRISLIIQS